MARRLISSSRAGQVLATAACALVLATGCTQTVTPPVRATGASESVQGAESATQLPTSTDGGGNGGAGAGGNGGGVADGEGGGNQAAGSPIDVPAIPAKHESMGGLRDTIKNLFVTACGGHDLCVKLEYGDGACFVGYAPAGQAARGSTVRVLTESQEDCDRAKNPEGSGAATDGSTQGSTPSTDVPDFGTTTPQTDVPSSGTSGAGTDPGTPGTGQPDGSSR